MSWGVLLSAAQNVKTVYLNLPEPVADDPGAVRDRHRAGIQLHRRRHARRRRPPTDGRVRPLFDPDAMVAGARDLCTALLRDCEPYGCFRWREQPLPNLLYLNDVVMLCWVIDDLPADPALRARWAATLNRFQYPEGGAYCYPPFARQSWQHRDHEHRDRAQHARRPPGAPAHHAGAATRPRYLPALGGVARRPAHGGPAPPLRARRRADAQQPAAATPAGRMSSSPPSAACRIRLAVCSPTPPDASTSAPPSCFRRFC